MIEPRWQPDEDVIATANVTDLMRQRGLVDFEALYRWSISDRAAFWEATVRRLGIKWRCDPRAILGEGGSIENPDWFPGARLNIAESCFGSEPGRTAIVYQVADRIERMTYRDLQRAANRVANGLRAIGVEPGDRVAIAMPMSIESVIAYLGIVLAGGVVVSIADSFAPREIATRLAIAGARRVITQDEVERAGKTLPMYAKVVAAGADRAIVVDTGAGLPLRPVDVSWDDFLAPRDEFPPVAGPPDAYTNILFSSGTTGDPKAIPWTSITPIKAASDGHYHHDIHPTDVVAWPTNLGWMMGPWLIYASLINRATMALYNDVPTGVGFGRFVATAGVTMLGVVPSLVAAWRRSGCMEDLDWSAIRLFSSTGEVSNAADMAYLMDLAGNKPIIEYIGGTEIGGGYLAGTVVQPAIPATFSTPTLGTEIRILDESGTPATAGELFIVPPAVGLSTELLNRDHHEVYYAGTPRADVVLRRHGDYIERLADGYFRANGRVDDTMNLGGIKVSSAEIEQVVLADPNVRESAAVAVDPPGGGPSRLVMYVVPAATVVDELELQESMQNLIRSQLNPLFRIADVVLVDELPRTASAKVMRRSLRARYEEAT